MASLTNGSFLSWSAGSRRSRENLMTAFHPLAVAGIDPATASFPRRWRSPLMRTLAQSARDLTAGMSSRSLVEDCLDRIADAAGEGRRTFLKVHADQARAAADYIDGLRRHRAAPSRFAGIPVSVKDLFDMAGGVPPARSGAPRHAPPPN